LILRARRTLRLWVNNPEKFWRINDVIMIQILSDLLVQSFSYLFLLSFDELVAMLASSISSPRQRNKSWWRPIDY
jgi:hypothetical protein